MLHPSLERLAQNVFYEAYASDGKVGGVFQPARRLPKSQALEKPVLQINGPRRICYLSFDVDRWDGGWAWAEANLPQPTFIVKNPANGHAHLIWEIDPIWLPAADDTRPGEPLPVRFMKAVIKAIRRDLKADNGYNGLLVKNPLHAAWDVIIGPAKPYRLTDLAAHLEFDENDEAELQDNAVGRNCTLFDSIRYWAYRNRNGYTDWYRFKDDLGDELDRLNQQLQTPLPFSEVAGIDKSVSSWVWNRYTGNGDIKRRGIMALDPTEALRIRQQKGQAFTSQLRSDSTVAKIKKAVDTLTRNLKPVTKVAVAQLAGIHRNTVARHWPIAPIAVGVAASLQDKSRPSLRSGAAAPRQGDTLIATQCSTTKPPTYPELLSQHNGNMLKAAQGAQRYARQGILIDDIPKTFETALRADVDRYRTERSLEMH